MYPFNTPTERRTRERSEPNLREQPGVRVTYPNDVKHWFPGPEPIALLLAQRFCPEELLNHPGTTVEFGTRCGTLFVSSRHVAGPKLSKASPEDLKYVPTVLTPDPT